MLCTMKTVINIMMLLGTLFSECNDRKCQMNGLLELRCQVFSILAGITCWMFGLLVRSSLQKWEGGEHST